MCDDILNLFTKRTLCHELALIHDAPLMHHIAWRIGEGAVSYRDLFEMNSPRTYLRHGLLLTLVGPGDMGFRLAWLGGTSALIFVHCRRFGAWSAATPTLLFGRCTEQ